HGTLQLPTDARDEVHDIDLTLTAAPLAFRDIRSFVPALSRSGHARLDAQVQGTSGLLHATADLRLPDGATLSLDAEATPAADGPLTYRLDGRIRGLDPGYVTGDLDHTGRINADLHADLHGPAPDHLNGTARARLFDTHYGEYAPDPTTLHATFTDGKADFDLETGLREAVLTLTGTLRPLDETPTYDLQGRLDSLDIGRFAPETEQSSDIRGTFRLKGHGFDPRTADLTATVALAPSRINRDRLNEGTLTAHLTDGTLDVDTRLQFASGRAETRGTAHLGNTLRYRIREGRVENLNVAALLGDTTHSAFNGTFALHGQGVDPAADLRLNDLRLDLTDSSYGPYALRTGSVAGTLRRGRLDLTARAELDGGTFDVEGIVHPFADVPAFALTRADFEHVDVGKLTQNPAQHSDLTGTLRGSGRGFDPATLTLDEVRLDLIEGSYNQQRFRGGYVGGTLHEGHLDFDAMLETSEGINTFGGTGTVGETLSLTLREGAVHRLNLGAFLGLPHLDTDLNGTVSQLEIRGSDPQAMTVKAGFDLEPSRFNDEMIREGTMRLNLDGGFVRAGATLDLEQGEAELNASGRFFDDRPAYKATGTIQDVDLGRLSGIDTLQAGFSATFDVQGTGIDPETMRLQGRLDATQARYDDVRLNTVHTLFGWNDGVLEVDTLHIDSNVATLAGSGPVALFDTTHASSFALDGDLRDAKPLRSLLNAAFLTVGEGRLEGRLFGDPGSLRFEARTSLNSVVYDDIRIVGFDAGVSGSLDHTRRLIDTQAWAEMTQFSLPTFSVRYSELRADYAENTAAFFARFTVDRRRDARLSGRVDLHEDHRRVTIDDVRMNLDDERWQLLQEATLTYDDAYRISNLLLYEDDQQVAIDGIIDPNGNQNLILTIEQFRIGAVADLLDFPGLDGLLNGDLELTGPAEAPLMAGTLHLDVESNNQAVGTLRTNVRYDSLRLNLDAALTHREGSILTLNGYFPMDLRVRPNTGGRAERPLRLQRQQSAPDSDVSLHLRADHFDIGWIEPFLDREVVNEVEGKLTADVDIRGTLENPVLAGRATLDEGRLSLPELGVTYTDLNAEADLADNRVALNHAALRSGRGRLTAQGAIDLAHLTLGEFHLSARADNFRAIDTRAYRADVSADLELSGTTRAPELNGTVQLLSADIYLTDETTADEFGPVELTEQDLQMLERHFGLRVTEADTTTFQFFDALAMDLTVEMERDVWLRSPKNPEMNIQFTGDLELKKEAHREQQLFGSVKVIPERSYINQFGKRFNITTDPTKSTNTLTFNGPATDPLLDMAADYEVRSRGSRENELVVTLLVKGGLDNLTLELRSEPETDLTNIISYIATGRPAGQAFQQIGVGTGAEIAFSQLAGFIQSAAGSELGLDVIEIRNEGLQGATVTAGKYLSRRFYFAVSWPISFTNNASSETGTNTGKQFTIEYELFNWLLLRMVRVGPTISFNLLYEYAY
ncbi:MAG: translocation/assembly module TamB domain-containing protein, partial [Rhodothermales bacterium]